MPKEKKLDICVDVSNSTTLSWEESHRAVYLTPEDFVNPHVREVENGYKARMPYIKAYFIFDRISGHHLIRSETYKLSRHDMVKSQKFENLEILCGVSDADAIERCRQLAEECLKV